MIFTVFGKSNRIDSLKYKKYQLKRKGKGIFKKFPVKKYQKTLRKFFYKRLVSKNILFGNKRDINIIAEIIDNISRDVAPITKSSVLSSFFKTIFLPITIIYSVLSTLILSQSDEFMSDFKLVIALGLILAAFVYLANWLEYLVLEILNRKSRKRLRLVERLSLVKLHLIHKYQKK